MRAVRDRATVVVTQPVDGTRRRRASARPDNGCGPVETLVVDQRVWAAARAAKRDDQRIIIVSATEVLIVNQPTGYSGNQTGTTP